MDTDVIITRNRDNQRSVECARCLAMDLNDTHFNSDGICLTRNDLAHNLIVKTTRDVKTERMLDGWDYTQGEPVRWDSHAGGNEIPKPHIPTTATDDPARQCFIAELAFKRGRCAPEQLRIAVKWLLSVYERNLMELSAVRRSMLDEWLAVQG